MSLKVNSSQDCFLNVGLTSLRQIYSIIHTCDLTQIMCGTEGLAYSSCRRPVVNDQRRRRRLAVLWLVCGGCCRRPSVVEFGFPNKTVICGQHDGGQRHGQYVGQNSRQSNPLFVCFSSHFAFRFLARKSSRTFSIGCCVGSESRTRCLVFFHPVSVLCRARVHSL